MARELLCNFKDYMSTWFYDKDTVYTKEEVDEKLGDIETILDEIVGV